MTVGKTITWKKGKWKEYQVVGNFIYSWVQVELAMRLDLPLVLHVRDAQKEALDILLDMDVPTNYRSKVYKVLAV